jgi:hypothetical protein
MTAIEERAAIEEGAAILAGEMTGSGHSHGVAAGEDGSRKRGSDPCNVRQRACCCG